MSDGPQLRPGAAHAPQASGIRHRGCLDLPPAEAASDLEDLLVDVPAEKRVLPDFRTPLSWEFDSFIVARSVVQYPRDASEESLEELVAIWLGKDPQNRPVLRLTLIDSCQERPGIWLEN